MADQLLNKSGVHLASESDCLKVTGQPGFDNAMVLADAGVQWLKSKAPSSFAIDVSEVTTVNSGVLCVLLEWLRYAKSHHMTVTGIHLSQHLKDLVDVTGLNAIPEFGLSKPMTA